LQKWCPTSERAQEEDEGKAPVQAVLLLLQVQVMDQGRKEAGGINGVMVPLPVLVGVSAPAPADLLPAAVAPLGLATAPGLVRGRGQGSVQGLLGLRVEMATHANAWETVDAMAVATKAEGGRIIIIRRVIIIYIYIYYE